MWLFGATQFFVSIRHPHAVGMALHTAVAFVLLGIAIVAARPASGAMPVLGRRQAPGSTPARERGERAPGRGQDFDRAQDSLAVADLKARRGLGVALGKLGVQLGARARLSLQPHFGSNRLRRRGRFG